MGAIELTAKIKNRSITLGIIGLGYVGLPLAVTAVKSGFKVLGFDIDERRVNQVNRAESIIKHISAEAMLEVLRTGRLEATALFERLSEADALLICVPTPLTRYREPDLSYVVDTAKEIALRLRADQLIVLESTTYPGTTREVVRPVLEGRGLRSGKDFFLAYSPEREDPGNEHFSTAKIPKVVGGDGVDAVKLAGALYDQLVVGTVAVSSTDVAEAVKLTENIFRAVNIALVNELKVVYQAMGIDIWEVIDAAKTKPFGYMPFYPGPGLGGHCIPIDPFYLTWKAREYDIATRFIELAGEINRRMPYQVVETLTQAMDRQLKRGVAGSKLLIVGLAYKKNVDDIRESPSFKLIELLEARGAHCAYHDPYVPSIPLTREHPDLAGRNSVPLSEIKNYDLALIATDHDSVDYSQIVRDARLVLDTRNACARAGVFSANVVKA